MIWLDSLVKDLDLYDVEKRIGMVTMVVIIHEDKSTHAQLGKITGIERYESESRMYLAITFKDSGYLFAEGPFDRVQLLTTPAQDKFAGEVDELIGQLTESIEQGDTRSKPTRWLDRTIASVFGIPN